MCTDEVVQRFNDLLAAHNNSLSEQVIRSFVSANFLAAGEELNAWTPTDWNERLV
jgi:hypothetical protein